MNQDRPEPTLEESVKQVMRALPPPIRDYLSRGKYTPVAKDLMAKYGLRIDQGGILERGMMLLLMGIEDPNEFMQSLLDEAKLDQRTVNGIMQDVNMQIFIPLREEMQKESVAAPEAPRLPQSYFHLENKIPLPQQSHHSLSPVPRKPALRDVLASVMKAPPDTSNSSVGPRKLLADHEESHIEFSKSSTAPPENLPSAPREIHTPPALPTPESRTQPPKQNVSAAPAKPYSVDPYREPVDEK